MKTSRDISWKKLSERLYKAGHRKMIEKIFRLPAGNVESFDVVDGGKVVCILALTTENEVILTKQFRPAQEKILTEMPGGGVNKEEDPAEAAARELLEETGYIGDIIFITESLESAYNTLVRYNYIALHCKKVSEPKLEDNQEPIEVTLMNLIDFKEHLYSGMMTDVATGFYGLEYLRKNRIK